MKLRSRKKLILAVTGLSMAAILIAAAGIWCFWTIAGIILPLDLSQDYRSIPGIENIVFCTYVDNTAYKRCFWGLRRAEPQQEYEVAKNGEVVPEAEALAETFEGKRELQQAVLSPDGNYILYKEILYDYTHSKMTDDEYCYYRVYDRRTGEITTIFQGYRKHYKIGWQ